MTGMGLEIGRQLAVGLLAVTLYCIVAGVPLWLLLRWIDRDLFRPERGQGIGQ